VSAASAASGCDSRPLLSRRASLAIQPVRRRTLRAAALALILAALPGCDKARDLLQAGQAAVPPHVSVEDALDLSAKPIVLFQVFGERSAPRIIPIAAIREGRLEHIRLDQDGWQQFDQELMRSGLTYPVFHDGQPRGELTVTQGMWEHDESIYSLPGCRTLTPIASVALNTDLRTNFTVELLASNAQLGGTRTARVPSSAAVSAEGRRLGVVAGEAAGISRALLDSLDFHGRAINTGRSAPTMVGSFIDPSTDNARSTSMRTAHVFVLADADANGQYHPSFTHAMKGPLARAEYRRFFDHLDLTGDGVDEIIVEGWQFGGDTYLAVLALRDGAWQEIFRTRSNWCLDERPRG
jgi:hypothetical protein